MATRDSTSTRERRPLLAGVSNDQLARDASVVLLSTRGLDRKSRDAIAAFVRNGGGLFIAASDDVEPAVLATMMGWEGFSATVRTSPRERWPPTDMRHPIFRPFGALAGDLGQGQFDRTWTVRANGWDVLARFTDGAPALLERRDGRGRMVLFTSDVIAAGTISRCTRHSCRSPSKPSGICGRRGDRRRD